MIGPEQVRDATEQVLSRPGYRELSPDPIGRLVAEIRSWLAELLFRLFENATAGGVGVVVAVLVVGVVAALGIVALLGVRRRRAVDLVVAADEATTSTEALAAADAARAAGDLTTAVRRRYGGMVLLLTERDVLPVRAGTTVGEVDATVAVVVPSCAADVAAAGTSLAEIVYGHRPAVTADDDTVQRAVRRLDATVPVAAAVAR